MNVSLTPELEEMVNKKVESGMYVSASEVIRDALRLMQDMDAVKEQRLERLRQEIEVGLKQLDAGLAVPLDEKLIEDIKARGRERLAAERRQEGKAA